jgi:hypothetical protein
VFTGWLCVHRAIPATYSDDSGHPFRRIPVHRYDAIPATFRPVLGIVAGMLRNGGRNVSGWRPATW